MRFVILGAGPSGLTAAEAIRQRDSAAHVRLLSPEPSPLYSPPAMVDYFSSGREDALFWKGRDFCSRLGVEVLCAEVASVRPEDHEIGLSSGDVIPFDRLIIATGGRLDAPVLGAERSGVYNFKSLAVASALVERVRKTPGTRAAIVGAGFIGVEIALLLRQLGADVTMIEMSGHPMPRILDREAGNLVLKAIRDQGVRVRLGEKAVAFEGDPDVCAVALESGERVPADVFVAATGTRPNVEFLRGAGIDVKRGICVDRFLCTSAPDIFAAGDVAETPDRLTGQRGVWAIFPNAVEQGRVAARNALGDGVAYEGALRMNSLKHLGFPVVVAGESGAEEERRYESRPGVLRRLFVRDHRIVGYQLIGDIAGAGMYQVLMLRRADIRRLGDDLASSRRIGRLVFSAVEVV